MVDFNIRIVIDTRRSGQQLNRIERSLRNIERRGERVSRGLRRAFNVAAIALASRELIRLADTYTLVQNRLRIVTDGQTQLANVTEQLLDVSNRTRTDFQATAELYGRTALAARDLGRSQQELVEFTESVNQAIILSGASAAEASQGLIQLSQGIASNRLSGDELRSVLEQLPIVADVIAKELGVTRGELRKLGEQGVITGEVVLDAFKSARVELTENFGETVPTIGQSFQVLGNTITNFVGTLDRATGASQLFSGALLLIANGIEKITEAVEAAEDLTADPGAVLGVDINRLLLLQQSLGRLLRRQGELEAFRETLTSDTARETVDEQLARITTQIEAYRNAITKLTPQVDQDTRAANVNTEANEDNAQSNEGRAAALKRVADEEKLRLQVLERVLGPQQRLNDELRILRQLLDEGAISQAEFNRRFAELGQFEGPPVSKLEEFLEISDLINSSLVNAFSGAEDALVDFVTTGEADFKALADSILRDLARIAIRQAILGIFGPNQGDQALNAFRAGVEQRQAGGPFRANQDLLVGESGREIVRFPTAGRVIPAGATAAQMNQRAAAPNVNVDGPQVNIRNEIEPEDPQDRENEILNTIRRNPRRVRGLLGR